MRIELFLNPEAEGYVDFVQDLKEELGSLKGLKYEEELRSAPPKSLSIQHEAVKFLFEHGGKAIPLVTALMQLIRAVLERQRDRVSTPPGKDSLPLAVLKVDDRELKFPSSPPSERTFLKNVEAGKTRKKEKKSKGKGTKGRRPRKKKRK
jgi:hypothetical protein